MATCAGCPAELPPAKPGGGRERKWCSERCRKSQYAGRCVDCGAATNGSEGRGKRASTRCQDCSHAHQREAATWTRERLIAEARRWYALTGSWPVSTHWHHSVGGAPDAAFGDAVLEFRERTGPWPFVGSIGAVFGSWTAFMAAAGGQAPGTREGTRQGQRAAEMRAALAKIREGAHDDAG